MIYRHMDYPQSSNNKEPFVGKVKEESIDAKILKTYGEPSKESVEAVEKIFSMSPKQLIDAIKPPHYNKYKITPLEFILANELDFVTGNIIKYCVRHKDKNGKEDLLKAKEYLEILIKQYDTEQI